MALPGVVGLPVTPELWDKVGALFDAALEVPEPERFLWLENSAPTEEIRQEVISLLRSHDAAQGGGFVQHKIQQAVVSFQQIASGISQPLSVGPYTLLRELGSGGMGVVFLAERSDGHYTSQVAIKLIRPGMDTEFIVARFRRERQTLARLHHPNIARLLDGGTTEGGLPYLVMEYIDGVTLTQYARREKLPATDRIQLFLQVCAAVDYAHRNFVIHRDIKPGNILVTGQGEPKLLDFGICKLLQNEAIAGSETRAHMLTPDYASPEQILGGVVTPLSDVYSLGVVLYQLMSECLPRSFDGLSIHEIQTSVDVGKIRPPSEVVMDLSVSRLLTGDLDNIILHALDREPERRYQSAALLADDLNRYFAHEPIHAKPPTTLYRLRKFLKRNLIPVAAVASVLFALSAGLFIAIREAKKANDRVRQVQKLAGKLVFEVHDSIATLPGATKARELIVKTGLENMDSLAGAVKSDPDAALDLARSYRRLGDVEGGGTGANLGNSAAALVSYRKALGVLEGIKPRASGELASATEHLILYDRIGALQIANGKFEDAVRTLAQAIASATRPSFHRDVAFDLALSSAYVRSAEAKRNTNDWNGAYNDASQSLLLSASLQPSPTQTLPVQRAIAEASAAVGIVDSHESRLDSAAQHFRQGVAALERIVAQDPGNAASNRELMLAYGHVADVAGNPAMENQGDRLTALVEYGKAAKIGKALHEADLSDQRAAIDYGIVISRMETVMTDADGEARRKVQKESLDIMRKAARKDPKSILPVIYETFELQHLGDSWRAANQPLAALECYREALTIADPIAKAGTQTGLLLYIGAASRIARAEAFLGRREQAIQSAQLASAALDGKPAASVSLILPRSYSAVGYAYADLLKSSARLPSDRNAAVSWMTKSADAWHAAQKDKGFSAPHLREMREVEATLDNLSRR